MKPITLSKRRYRSLLWAEKVAQELRFQIAGRHVDMDLGRAASFVILWMRETGKHKYDRPEPARNGRLSLPVRVNL